MSNEDDEVILEGNPLYNYMQEVGVLQLDEISVARPSGAPPATRELQSSGFVGTVFVSEHVCRLLELIFNSHLMFDDDFNFVSSCVPEVTVQPNRYRCRCIAVTVAAALNAGIILFNKCTVSSFLKNLSILPSFIITLGSAGYVSKLIFDNYKEQREEKDLTNHIKVLQKFYKLLQRIVGDIRDIDMLIRGSRLKSQHSGDDDHKLFLPLIKFRIAIVTALIEIGKTMSNGFINLRELVPEIVKQTDFTLISTSDLLPDYITFDETKMSVNDLNNLNRTYQLVQSEYLRWLALCYCTVRPKNELLAKKVCVKVVESVHSVVLKYYCELNFQHVVSLYGRSYGRSVEKQKVAGNGHVDVLIDSVHNVMIHLVSLMEEAKRIESSLHISSSLVHEGKQSAEESLKFFDIKFSEFKIKLRNVNDHILKMDIDLKKQMTTISSASLIETKNEKHTKEHLSGTSVGAHAFELTGKSDFSVRGEHEVFIGTSCNDTYMVTDTGEEYVFERRQLMPNVLSELKTALRPVYEMHAERERQALLRTGRSCLETVAEEEFSNNTSECSSGIKDTDEINSPRPVNKDGAEVVLDNQCSNLVALCSTYMPAETGRNISVSRYDTTNSSILTSTGFPDMNVSGSFSCVTGISSETYHCTEAAGDTINNPQHNLPASNNVNISAEVGTSSMFSTHKHSPSVIDTNVTEFNTVVATDSSCLPKSLAKDIIEQKLIANSWACAIADSSKSTNCLSHSAAVHTASVCPPISEEYEALSNPDITSSSEFVLSNVDDISQRNEIHETLLSGIGNLRMLSKQKTLIEEQFIYDGDSDTELSN